MCCLFVKICSPSFSCWYRIDEFGMQSAIEECSLDLMHCMKIFLTLADLGHYAVLCYHDSNVILLWWTGVRKGCEICAWRYQTLPSDTCSQPPASSGCGHCGSWFMTTWCSRHVGWKSQRTPCKDECAYMYLHTCCIRHRIGVLICSNGRRKLLKFCFKYVMYHYYGAPTLKGTKFQEKRQNRTLV